MTQHAHHYEAKVAWQAEAGGSTKDYKSYSRNHKVSIPGKAALALSADPSFRGDPALHRGGEQRNDREGALPPAALFAGGQRFHGHG